MFHPPSRREGFVILKHVLRGVTATPSRIYRLAWQLVPHVARTVSAIGSSGGETPMNVSPRQVEWLDYFLPRIGVSQPSMSAGFTPLRWPPKLKVTGL